MKKTILILTVCMLSAQFAFSQKADHYDWGQFEKKVKYNTFGGDNMYDISSKSTLDKILFGESNSFVEYVFSPDLGNPYKSEFKEVLALRIVEDSMAYKLEIFRYPEYRKDWSEIYDYEYHRVSPFPEDSLMTFADFLKFIRKHESHIKGVGSIYAYRLHKKYGPKPTTFEISKRFATKLHDMTTTLIRDFKAVRVTKYEPNVFIILTDQPRAQFRCVVGDELWSLWVPIPQKRALQLSNLLNHMIIDLYGGTGKFNEKKYIKLLNEIDL